MRLYVLPAMLIGWITLPGLVQAQISNPIFKGEPGAERNVVYNAADQAGDLQHGKKLRITLNNSEISGIVVRVDKATRKIYLRTEPGMPPRAFAVDDVNIKKVEKVGIKQVAYTEVNGIKRQDIQVQDVYEPEIQPVVIINGNKRTVSYVAPTLSPGERDYLGRMEAAENELGRLENLAERQARVLDTDIAIQEEALKTQELSNLLLWKYGEHGVFGLGPTLPWMGQFQSASLPSAIRQGPTVFPNLPVAPEALAQAREAFSVAHGRTVFENGRLIAVVLDNPRRMEEARNK